MYDLVIHKKTKKFFIKHKGEKIIKTLQDILKQLQHNPRQLESIDIKKMQGFTERYRIRFGKYRLIYEIYDEEVVVLVVNIDSRGSIYK